MTKNRINFVDLGLVNKKYKARYLNLVKKIYEESSFIKSKYNFNLEKQICKTFKCKYSLCVNSGTDALIIAVKSLGLKNGDEILTTSNTWISSAYAISLNNCKPIFVDIDPETLLIDVNKIEEKITHLNKMSVKNLALKALFIDWILNVINLRLKKLFIF